MGNIWCFEQVIMWSHMEVRMYLVLEQNTKTSNVITVLYPEHQSSGAKEKCFFPELV